MPRKTRPVKSARRKKSPVSPRAAQLIAVGVALAFIAIIVAIVVSSLNRAEPQALPTVAPSDAGELLRENPHLLSDVAPQDADAVLVEFVDFQCPACATASPIVQQVADEYGDRLAVVVRNLPLTSIHPHAVEAAVAAEAAAAQGEFAAMYKELFATHQEWSSARGDQSDTFRDLAEQLGLDMDEYDRVADDPATRERIALDQADAFALGATGTPSFFLDGELVQLNSFDDLRAAVESALQESATGRKASSRRA